jgi:uncharacterized membrane protein
MTELVVVGFKRDRHRAARVLRWLREDRLHSWKVDLSDAVAVYLDHAGWLRVDHGGTGEGPGPEGPLGGFIRTMRASLTSDVCFAGLGGAAPAIDAETWAEDSSVPPGFAKRVGTMLQPGDSAIVALLDPLDLQLLTPQFRGYDGAILNTPLSDEQRATIDAALDNSQ